jgi:hypothetical protein
LFSVKGFVDGQGAGHYFAFAAAVIVGSNIAATIAAAKRAGRSVEQRTCAIGKLWKGDSINGIVSRPIGHGWLQFPLWIKVPTIYLLLAKSLRRCFSCRWPPKLTTIQYIYQE